MKNYLLKYMFVYSMFFILSATLFNNLKAEEPDWIFDWNTYSGIAEGVTTIPRAGEVSGWEDLYDTQEANDGIIGLLLRNMNGPYDGSTDPDTISDVMDYLDTNSYYLNFVFADFESDTEDENCIEMVDQVRAHSNSAINSAYIGNYDDYAGTVNLTDVWGNFERTAKSNFYVSSGMNISMPVMYPYTAHRNHNVRDDIFGTDICVSIAHALFWAPLERYSTAKRSLPSGHVIIPWIGGLVDNPGYMAPVPSKTECRSVLQHARLRGANGYYTWSKGANTNYSDNADFRDDMFENAWQPLNWFFALSGDSDVLNLATNKTGGVEWSGIRRGNRCIFIFSNYTTSSQQVDLPDTIENIPDLSPSIAPGEHLLMDYVIGPMSYFKFDENTGSATVDEMVAENDGALSGATWASGKSGSALSFDGNDHVTVSDSNTLDLSNEITVSFWIYPTAYNSGYAAHLVKKRAGTPGANFDMYFFGATAGSYYKNIRIYAEAGGTWKSVSPLYEVAVLNKWYHIAWTYSSTTGGKLYVDGVDQGTAVGSGSLSINTEDIYIGNGFTGKMDEVKIYSGALSEQEVFDEYACVANWIADERSGSNLSDSAIYGNDGTITGASWDNGKFGSALSFDGNDYVTVSDDDSLDLADEISVSFWFYPTAYNSGYAAHFLEKRAGTSGANFDMYFFGSTAGSYYKKIRIYAEAGGTWKSVSPLYEVATLDKWYHIAWTYSSTFGGKLYVDGVDQGTAVGSGSLSINTETLSIGSGFTGKMDEVKIYNQVLDADEISRLIP
jgi:Concanavalin A-like lectin/glucanases superfamily